MAFLIGGHTLFLHVPKTAGTAISQAFFDAGVQVTVLPSPGTIWRHATEIQLYNVPTCYEWKYRFGFVRHPVAWWHSLWKFTHQRDSIMLRPKRLPIWHLNHPFNEIFYNCKRYHKKDANEFITRMIDHHPEFYSRMIDAFFGESRQGVDFIGRVEKISSDLKELCKLRALPEVDLKGVNASRPPSSEELSERVVDLICESEKKIVEEVYDDG